MYLTRRDMSWGKSFGQEFNCDNLITKIITTSCHKFNTIQPFNGNQAKVSNNTCTNNRF